MRVQRYDGGFTLHTRGRKWDYWRPGVWLPLSVRHAQQHWWGTLVRRADDER